MRAATAFHLISQVGDRILYKKYTGQEVKVERDDLIVLEEREILAKVIV